MSDMAEFFVLFKRVFKLNTHLLKLEMVNVSGEKMSVVPGII